MLNVRITHTNDVDALATRLREADLREIAAATGDTPHKTLGNGLSISSPCYTIINETGQPLAMFGVVPDEEKSGIVWLLGSDKLLNYPNSFLRSSHKWIGRLHKDYYRLWNYVDSRNEVHIRWLKWCGFKCTETVDDFGREKRLFYRFDRVDDTPDWKRLTI